jgi:hypothetical protein
MGPRRDFLISVPLRLVGPMRTLDMLGKIQEVMLIESHLILKSIRKDRGGRCCQLPKVWMTLVGKQPLLVPKIMGHEHGNALWYFGRQNVGT